MMEKTYLTVLFLFMIFSVAYSRQQDKTDVQNLYDQLEVEKKAEVRQALEVYREQMQELLTQQGDPVLRREKVKKLRSSRDSSLKMSMGESLYKQYQKLVEEKTNVLQRKNQR